MDGHTWVEIRHTSLTGFKKNRESIKDVAIAAREERMDLDWT
jgi:hypothetical protein